MAIQALDSINGEKNIIRIRPDKIMCNTFVKGRCVSYINGDALYFDSNHLSNLGAKNNFRECFSSHKSVFQG